MSFKERKVPKITSLADLIAELRCVFEEDDVDTDYVQEVMAAYDSNPKEWKRFAHFDRHRYAKIIN